MAEYLGDALFELRANIAPLKAGMMEAESIVSRSTRSMQGELARNVGNFSKGLGSMGHQLTRTLTVPILGIGAASAKMAIDFQAAMENIHTQAGASQKEVNALSKSVLGLAKNVPYGPTALADALYHLESIGLRVSKNFEQQGIQVRKQIPLMQVLKTAAQGAAVGHSNLEQTTTALGSAWLSGIKGATNLKTAMGTLNAIVGVGNMRMQDLVSALGTGVLPMAKLAGLGFKDVGAALAIMSDEGYNVTSAATQMGTALHYLFDPTQKAATALGQIGLNSGALAGDMHKPQGLLTALTDLKTHLDKAFPADKGHALTAVQTAHAVDTFQASLERSGVSGKKLSDALDKYKAKLKEFGSSEVAQEAVLGDIFPAGRGRVLLVLMNQLANYESKLKQVNENQKKFGGDVAATQQTAAYKIHQAWASIQSDLTSFGENVLPPLLNGVKGVADEIGKVGRAFDGLSPDMKKAVVTGGLVVAAIGPAMRIASFFMGGVGKLLSAATIASRLAMGKGWRDSFSGGTSGGGASGGTGLTDLAEMRVNQMVVTELIARNIPGVGGTGSRVRGARSAGGVSSAVAAAEADAGPTAPPGYVYDPVLGMNIKKATGSTPNVASVAASIEAPAAVASQPRYVPTAGPTSSRLYLPTATGGRAFEQTLAGEMRAEQDAIAAAEAKAARSAANYRPRSPLTGRLLPMSTPYLQPAPMSAFPRVAPTAKEIAIAQSTASRMELASLESMAAGAQQLKASNMPLIVPNMRSPAIRAGLQSEVDALTADALGMSDTRSPVARGRAATRAVVGTKGLTAAERFAQAYPQGTFAQPRLGVVSAEEEAAAMAAKREASLGPNLVERAASNVAGAASTAGSMAMRVLGGLGFVAMLAPMGIALGAAVHGWIEHKAAEEGNDFADKFLGRFPKAIQQQFHKGVADATTDLKKSVENQQAVKVRLQYEERGTTPQNPLLRGVNAAADKKTQDAVIKAAAKLGEQTGEATVEGLQQGVAFSAQGLEREFSDTLGSVGAKAMKHGGPAAAQEAKQQAAITMLNFATELEQKGKLSESALGRVMKRLEQEVPGFSAYLASEGINSDKAFAKALQLKDSSKALSRALANYRQQFSDTQGGVKITMDNVVSETGRAIKHIADEIADPSTLPSARKKYIAELQKLKTQAAPIFVAMTGQVSQFAKDMTFELQTGGAKAAQAMATNLNNMTANIAAAMKSGVLSTGRGGQLIGKAVVAVLKAYGTTKIPQGVINALGAADSAIPNPPQLSGGNMPRNAGAQGGVFQIGSPGERGGDNVPLSIMVGRGEKVAVFNASQQAVMDRHLSHYGGLNGMFSQYAQPHYATPKFATGGIAGVGPNFDGHPTNVTPGIRNLIGVMESKFPLAVTATTDGTHVPGSYHYKGEAVDMASTPGVMLNAASWIKGSGMYKSLAEGIHNPNLAVKFGQLYSGAGPFGAVWAGHANHIHLALTGMLGPAAQSAALAMIKAPRVGGDGTVPTVVRGALKMEAAAANDFVARNSPIEGPEGGSGIGGLIGMPNADNWQGALRKIAAEKGWSASDWLWVVNAESSGNPEAINSSSGAFGLGQFLGSTATEYAKYGATSHNPVAQIRAMAMYIQDRYGNPTRAKSFHLANNYYGMGGLAAATGLVPQGHTAGKNLTHSKKPPGAALTGLKAATQPNKGPTLADLTTAYNAVMGIEGDLQTRLGEYDSVSSRYSTDEGQAQYLNDDGSLNPAGVAKKTADDTDLLGRAQLILADYKAELGPVTSQLKDWLGAKAKTQDRINDDNKKLKDVNQKLTGIIAARTALSKPMKDAVTPIETAEKNVRNKYDPIIQKAEKAQSDFKPEVFHAQTVPAKASTAERERINAANKAGRAAVDTHNRTGRQALKDAVTSARGTEDDALNPLKSALTAAQAARAKHRSDVAAARFKLRKEYDTEEAKKKSLSGDISTLKGILTGAGAEGGGGDNTKISKLEEVGGKLGTLEWKGSKFVGINTTDQGAAYDEQTTIDSLKITLGQDASLKQPDDQQALADAQALAGFWQTQAEQSAQEAYVAEHQLGTLGGVAPNLAPYTPTGGRFSAYQQFPPYAGSFATGGIVPGPIGAPMTAIVHGQEKITPADSSGGDVHVHFANGMDWLKNYVSASVEDSTRGMARRAARRMPSQGGGIVYSR